MLVSQLMKIFIRSHLGYLMIFGIMMMVLEVYVYLLVAFLMKERDSYLYLMFFLMMVMIKR